jgi:acyl-CoA thioesterase-1
MRTRILAALACLLLLAGCRGPGEAGIPAGGKVLALGDSLTAGYGVAPQQAWPALLAGQSGWVVINGGISGDTTAGALARLPALLEEHAPALVLVTLGGNDMLRKVPEPQTLENLAQILAQARARGARVVLLATPRPSVGGALFRNLSAAEFYRTLAEAQRVPLIEDAIADVLSDPQLKVDPLHPNAAGHAKLAGKVQAELKRMGFLR